ncbi:MAG: T9SS type A sorting domain-containing protein, partial [candidate division Zixibacteria bacterium]|nr:T9SS type A sorting domain-containing protein [candidate division Zixibacteria bacterium]
PDSSLSHQDSAGYLWFDSDVPIGPDYNWIDITGIGDVIEFPGPDPNNSNTGHIDLGFNFEYYDSTFNSICISSNGWLSFTDSISARSVNKRIPRPGVPNYLLAPYWINLYPGVSGNVYFYSNNSDSVVIAWEDVPDAGSSGYYTFQVVLIAPDTVLFQYKSMDNGLSIEKATIGIENGSGTVGLQVTYFEVFTYGEKSVRFIKGLPPEDFDWLSINNELGEIPENESIEIELICSAGDHSEGTHYGAIELFTNDPENFYLQIPVVMNIGMTSIEPVQALPSSLEISSAYPNPFNSSVLINYTLFEDMNVKLDVYNILGRHVSTLVDEKQLSGSHKIQWKASTYSSGIYFYKLTTNNKVLTKRMTLLK